jgi:hypothetical protein
MWASRRPTRARIRHKAPRQRDRANIPSRLIRQSSCQAFPPVTTLPSLVCGFLLAEERARIDFPRSSRRSIRHFPLTASSPWDLLVTLRTAWVSLVTAKRHSARGLQTASELVNGLSPDYTRLSPSGFRDRSSLHRKIGHVVRRDLEDFF